MASGIRWTTEEFIEQSRTVHGDRYDYSKVVYVNNKTKVEVICKMHGPFSQLAQHHMRGRGCTQCGNEYNSERQRSNTEEFTQKAIEIHGNKYDYLLVDYTTSAEKVIITCKQHGPFPQTPGDHLSGYGCPTCGNEKGKQARTRNTEQFIKLAKQVHGDRYDYSLVVYKKAFREVQIRCSIHGIFSQKPAMHLQGQGCHKCAGTMRLTQDEFIERATETHGSKYDYSKVNYTNSATKVEILCLRHGSFFQAPRDHLGRHGCQLCYSSTGEERISNILTRWGIKFTRQKKFDKCRNKKLLPFDFYFQVGNCRILLEFDGDQHFQPVEHFGGIDHYQKTKTNDAIKTNFAKKHGFILIRVPYDQLASAEMILQDEIENHTGRAIASIAHRQRKTKASLFNPIRYKQVPLL